MDTRTAILVKVVAALAFIAGAFFLSSCAHDGGPTARTIAEVSCGGAAEAMLYAASRTGCPKIRVERADVIVRSTGKLWLVVKLNVCGEKRVYEKRKSKWRDVTWRLK